MRARVLALIAAVAVLGLRADAPLAVSVSSRWLAAPGSVMVTIRLREPVDADRIWTVEIDSGDFYRFSGGQLAGTRAPRIWQVPYRDLPAGRYWARALVGPLRGEPRLVAVCGTREAECFEVVGR